MSRLLSPRLAALAVLAFTATVNAQTVNVTMRAATPLTVSTTIPAIDTQTLPAGLLPANGQLVSTQGMETARSEWDTFSSSAEATASWGHRLVGRAQAGEHDVIVEFTATAPVTVGLTIEHAFAADVGTTVPMIAIDVGDDGFYEIFQGTAFSLGFGNFTLTPQPLRVRIRFAGTTMGGSVQSSLAVRAEPQNNLLVQPFGGGCVGNTMIVRPSFQDMGVVAQTYFPPINALSVLVLGLAPDPIVLPPLTTLPCLLLPRQDVLIPFFTVTEVQLALPLAVRPVDVWMQRAGLFNGQVFTAEAFLVRAF